VRDVLAELLAAPGEEFSANAIEAIVSRLRRKLTAIDAAVRIETVRGIGYRLRAASA
jgi:DNA-binding response OmpR family regulator